MKLAQLFSRSGRAAKGDLFAICPDETGVAFARTLRGGGKPKVLKCSYRAAANLTSASLARLAKEERIDGGGRVITLLDSREHHIQLVDGINVPPDEQKAAVRWRIKENLDYSVDDAAVDIVRVPTRSNSAQPLLAFAAASPTIKKRVDLFGKAKLNLSIIDVPVMAQRNIAQLFEVEGRSLALLSFDPSGCILTVTSGGELYMPRRFEIALAQLEDANEIKRQQSLDRLGLELQRSLDYFSRQFSWVPVQRLLIAAPDRLNLPAALAENLDVPVEPLHLADMLDISAVPDLRDSEFASHMILALGAALRDERPAP
ncbi:MAG: hypothetical protein LBV49_12150 [Azonexus sp.]|jgi:MSHA biogenesis protein MshI|nr:hypothetical protein [Azonexus sp.]